MSLDLDKQPENMYPMLPRNVFKAGFSKYIYACGYHLSGSHNISGCLVSARKASQNLPSLPVPDLQLTISKYLRSVRPLLCDNDFERTTRIANDFLHNCGSTLQARLLEKAAKSENWLYEWWLNAAYLDFRSPVVVFSSPGLAYPLATFKSSDERLLYAANMIAAAASYKKLIDNDEIPVDMMGKVPLDMGQYKKVFGTCRIPGIKRDNLQYHPNSSHIIVMYKNDFYTMDIFGDSGKPLSQNQLFTALKEIETDKSLPEEPIGILTTENRDNWGKIYEMLMKDEVNHDSIGKIQSALFLMCLDGPMPESRASNMQTKASEQLIHGGGFSANSANRWYDKTIQFVVGENGINGLTYEHSPAEGQPIAVMTDFIMQYITKKLGADIPDEKIASKPKKLQFKVDSRVRCGMEQAKDNIEKLIADLDMDCIQMTHFGKDFIKAQKLSPDSFIQIAMQLAFYRLHKVPGAHYESAATRMYKDGRTETIRSCSVESVFFSKMMLDDRATDDEKIVALRLAIEGHKNYTMDAIKGQGVDRHLLGLKLLVLENKQEIPEIYKDKGYVKSTHMRISSSQVATKCDGFMCYGPLVTDGYACCYNPRDKDINMAFAAHTSGPGTSATAFREAMVKSLIEMHDLLARKQPSKL